MSDELQAALELSSLRCCPLTFDVEANPILNREALVRGSQVVDPFLRELDLPE